MAITMYEGSTYALPLPDKSVDLIVTDPPFWGTEGAYYGGVQDQQLSSGKETDKQKYWEDLTRATREMVRVLKDDGNLIIHIGQGEYPHLNTFEYEHVVFCTKELGLSLTSEIYWEIGQNMFSFENLHSEFQAFRHYTKSREYIRNPFEITNLNPASWKIPFVEGDPRLLKIGGMGHGFPIELASRMVRCFSKQESIVLDPFAGTGTVNIAASLHGRNSVYLDYSAEQYALAKERFNLFNLDVKEAAKA